LFLFTIVFYLTQPSSASNNKTILFFEQNSVLCTLICTRMGSCFFANGAQFKATIYCWIGKIDYSTKFGKINYLTEFGKIDSKATNTSIKKCSVMKNSSRRLVVHLICTFCFVKLRLSWVHSIIFFLFRSLSYTWYFLHWKWTYTQYDNTWKTHDKYYLLIYLIILNFYH